MDILISIAAKVAEYTVAPIGRQLGYLVFYHRNIKDLEKQLKNLKTTRERVQILVNEARGNAYEIHDEVSTWLLTEVDVELPNMPQQNKGGSNEKDFNPSCLNFVQRHKLSRKSKKKVQDILQLIEEGKKFDKVGYPAPLPETKSSTLPSDYQILESRTLMAEKIKDALADPNINKVGVYGMGGVGKTKLLDEVKKLVLENKLFDRVIDVTIGQSNDVIGIQDQIGGKLNMRLNMKAETKEGRAPFLRNKLVEMKDNILIMLDDLWNEYDLEKEVGIPCRLESSKEGCKILMTSRSRDVLTNKMNTEKCFEVNSLNEEESWKFFMTIVGEFDKNGIEPVAKNVVKECGGLPIALKIIAKALKDKEVRIWKDALEKLENHVSVKIKGVSDKLYSCLKLSYHGIEDEETRLLFLLCSVFPDDHKISVTDLQDYAMGMRFLNDINNWEAAKNRVIELVDHLKCSSLLLESDAGNDYIQMHDVTRDVAKYIASNENKMSSLTYGCGQSEWRENDRCGSYNAIFVDFKDFSNLPPNLEFPNLQLLIVRNASSVWDGNFIQIPDTFFEGMEQLRVLDMTTKKFEPSMTSLKNLQTLCISYCRYCNDIDTIGQLKKLEILRIKECMIEELPATMSELTQLKVLDVSECSDLNVIPPNIISSMTKLEELSLWMSFNKWGDVVSHKNKRIKNVKLSELNYLTRLSKLRIEIQGVGLLSDDLSLERVEKLEEFFICVGHLNHADLIDLLDNDAYARRSTVYIKSQIVSNRVLEILLEKCEGLWVMYTGGSTKHLFKPNAYYCLKHLCMGEDSDMPRGIDLQVSFPELEKLRIEEGNNLEVLWLNNELTPNSFCKLQNIHIEYCNKLKYIFPSNMVTSLVFLNKLEIEHCELLEMIFEIEKLTEDVKVIPLTNLKLRHLPNLKYIWNKDPGEFMTFSNLRQVQVSRCPHLKSIFPTSFIKHVDEIERLNVYEAVEIFREEEASKLVFPKIVFPSLIHLHVVMKRGFWFSTASFPKLERLTLNGFDDDMVTLPLEMSQELSHITVMKCDTLKSLLPSSISFFKLSSIHICDCNGMINLFSSSVAKNLVSLSFLEISNCEGISSIIVAEGEEEKGEEIIFNKLTKLKLESLPRVSNFYRGKYSLKFPCLEKLYITKCPKMKAFSYGMNVITQDFHHEEVLFPSLRRLNIAPMLVAKKRFQLRSELFLKLKNLTLIGSKDDDTVTLPLEVCQILYNIENFEVKHVFQLVQVFPNEEENNHILGRSANLKKLELSDLPNLTYVWKDNTEITTRFDNLEDIDVRRCENLKSLLPSSVTFFNLSILLICDCNGMMNLFNSSAAKSLVNLSHVTISNCGGMSCIVAADEEGNGEIIFNKLTHLHFENLPRLSRFHSGKCWLKFPSLRWLTINKCHEMNTFSYGIISMPILEYLTLEKYDVPVPLLAVEGINVIVQDFWKDDIVRSIKNLFAQQGGENNEVDSKENSED